MQQYGHGAQHPLHLHEGPGPDADTPQAYRKRCHKRRNGPGLVAAAPRIYGKRCRKRRNWLGHWHRLVTLSHSHTLMGRMDHGSHSYYNWWNINCNYNGGGGHGGELRHSRRGWRA